MALSRKDFEKLKRLRNTFDENYRITQLFSQYLTYCPTLLEARTVDALTADTDLTSEDAIAALLTLALGIDDQRADGRTLMREYVYPSVRMLSAEKYYEDFYYQTVKIPETETGRFSFKQETYPAYRAMICDDICADRAFREIPPLGFFKEPFSFPAVLEDGNEWMTLTPVDVDTCQSAIKEAHGHVVTFGLGLGYYAFHVANKACVHTVTVVEKSRDVIELFTTYLLPQFPNKEKIRIVEDDAFSYAEHILPTLGADYVFVDTWRDASDGYPMYRRMKRLEHLCDGVPFSYWIEGFILSRMRAFVFEELWEKEQRAPHGEVGDVTFDELCEALSDEGLRARAIREDYHENDL